MHLGLNIICFCALHHANTRIYALLKEFGVVFLRQLDDLHLQEAAIDAIASIFCDAPQACEVRTINRNLTLRKHFMPFLSLEVWRGP